MSSLSQLIHLPLITTRVCEVMYSMSQERNVSNALMQYSDASGRHMVISPIALIDFLEMFMSTSCT